MWCFEHEKLSWAYGIYNVRQKGKIYILSTKFINKNHRNGGWGRGGEAKTKENSLPLKDNLLSCFEIIQV